MDLLLVSCVNTADNLSLQKPHSAKAASSNPTNWTSWDSNTAGVSVECKMWEHHTFPGLGCSLKCHQNSANPIVILDFVNADINPPPSLQVFTLTLMLYARKGAKALNRAKRAQKNAKSSHIKDGVTDEHVWISLLFYPGLFQWKAGSWHCWWKLRSGAHIFSPVIIDRSKAGTADMSSRMHCADFMSNTPSNHCLQLISTNHKLLTTRAEK